MSTTEITENEHTEQTYHLAKLTVEENEYAKHVAMKMWARGFKWKEIADAINADLPAERQVSFQAVHHFVKNIRKEWKQENRDVIDEHFARSLASLQSVEEEAWLGWQRSQEDSQTQTVNTTEADILHEPIMDGGAKGAPEVVGQQKTTNKSMTKHGNVGDPRYLDMVLRAQERRAKLLGLDAPVKIANADGGNIEPAQTNIQINVAEASRNNPDYAKDISDLSYKLGLGGAFTEPPSADSNGRQVEDSSASSDA